MTQAGGSSIANGGGGGSVGEVIAGLAALNPAAAAAAAVLNRGSGGAGGDEGAGVSDGGVDSSDTLEEVRHQVAEEYLPVMATIRDQLIAELKGVDKSEVIGDWSFLLVEILPPSLSYMEYAWTKVLLWCHLFWGLVFFARAGTSDIAVHAGKTHGLVFSLSF